MKGIIEIFKEYKIISPGNKASRTCSRRLDNNPILREILYAETHFLDKSFSDSLRLTAIIKDIVEEPHCLTCNTILYEFGKRYCNYSCLAKNKKVQEQRLKKARETCLNRFGYVNANKSKHVRDKIDKTNLERYGNRCSAQGKEIKERIRKTSIERYGVEHPLRSLKAIEKVKRNNIKKYGVPTPLESNFIQDKIKTTHLERIGVENPFAHEIIKEKIRNTNLERYGYESPIKSLEIQKKIQDTCIKRYGVTNPLSSLYIQEKIQKTNIDRYGVSSAKQRHIPEDSFKKLKDDEWLKKRFKELGEQCDTLAKELDVSGSTVYRALIKAGVKIERKERSIAELEIKDYIESIYGGDVVLNSREVISPKEIDIWIPKKKLGIEYNGLWWHSEIAGTPKDYHLQKTLESEKKGIRLIHIFENEWETKKEIVKSRIVSSLGESKRIWARKTWVAALNPKERKEFLNRSHLQGDCGSSEFLGLYNYDELVAVATFGKSRYNKSFEWELIRFSSKLDTTVVGGMSKLFKYFVKHWNPESIISYSDKRWGNGNVYKKCGFVYNGSTGPSYWYFNGRDGKMYHRSTFQKHKLSGLLQNFDEGLTEWENMKNNGWNRIFDCGTDVFIWKR
jgi:hypothetical protein